MEDKKSGRLGGSKVSQIANIFQGMAPNKESSSEYIGPIRSKSMPVESPTYEKESDPVKDLPTVTVMRTESHLARFNNARAMFEKLGVENKTKPDKFVPLQGAKSASHISDLRSRSSSANSESGQSSTPTPAPPPHSREVQHHHKSRSPSPTHCASEKLKSSTNSVPVLNKNITNGNSKISTNGVNGVVKTENIGVKLFNERRLKEKSNGTVAPVEEKIKETVHSENKIDDRTTQLYAVPNKKPEKPEKPERKFNSRELIEKQRNWTSHFSKTRSTRYNSDPNKTEVRLGISNGSKEKTEEGKVDQTSSGQPAARSQSFSARVRSPPTSPPPQPPIRTESAMRSNLMKKERPASVIPTTPVNVTNQCKTESVPVQLDNVVTTSDTRPTETDIRSSTKLHSPPHETTRPLSSSSLSPKSPHSMSKSPSEEPPVKENMSATSGSLSSLSSPSSPSRVRTEEEKQERESNEKNAALENSLSSLLSTSDISCGK